LIAQKTRRYHALCEALAAAVEPPKAGAIPVRSHRKETLQRPLLSSTYLDRCRMPLGRLVGLGEGGVIGICSARSHDDRSSVAAAFAILLARRGAGERVLLLDLDFANASQADLHSVAPSPGLADYLEGRERLRVTSAIPGGQPWLITAGTHLGDPTSLFHMLASDSMLDAFRQHFHWLVLDLPPLLGSPEAAAVAAQADWRVLVGRHRRTTVADVKAARDLMGRENTAAFLLTGDKARMPGWIRRLL
jgi:Mrp family chromosome partitioning ATPase